MILALKMLKIGKLDVDIPQRMEKEGQFIYFEVKLAGNEKKKLKVKVDGLKSSDPEVCNGVLEELATNFREYMDFIGTDPTAPLEEITNHEIGEIRRLDKLCNFRFKGVYDTLVMGMIGAVEHTTLEPKVVRQNEPYPVESDDGEYGRDVASQHRDDGGESAEYENGTDDLVKGWYNDESDDDGDVQEMHELEVEEVGDDEDLPIDTSHLEDRVTFAEMLKSPTKKKEFLYGVYGILENHSSGEAERKWLVRCTQAIAKTAKANHQPYPDLLLVELNQYLQDNYGSGNFKRTAIDFLEKVKVMK